MGLLENIKDAAELAKSLGNIDFYSQIVDLKDQVLELRDENRELKEQNRRLRDSGEIDAELERSGNLYYRPTSDPAIKPGPFCMTCWDTDRILVNVSLEAGYAKCCKCRQVVSAK
jgi:hypothetical protein